MSMKNGARVRSSSRYIEKAARGRSLLEARQQAAEIDLADNMGNAAGGVHVGALGGLWQAAVLGFAGLRVCGERPEHRATCRQAGAACRCGISGGANGTNSRFRKVRSAGKRRMMNERTTHPRPA